MNDVHSKESIRRWLNGGTTNSKRILGDGSKPGFKGFLPCYGMETVAIPTRAGLALGDLELKVEDEIVFSSLKFHQDNRSEMEKAIHLVVRVLEIKETDDFMPLVQLRGGAMCRSSRPLNNN